MFRLIGRLEGGELSELFRAERATAPATPVVVKLFHPRTSDPAYAKVIAASAKTLQTVTRPGIVHVLEVGTVNQRLAIVREAFGKFTLGQVLTRLNTREVHLAPALALAMVIELLETVHAAHQAGVVHGALTPGNVLVDVDGALGVADFGALAALQASPVLKRTFVQRGRGSYRAPEVGASQAPTVASDIYAIGAMAYELLTLREASVGKGSLSTRSARLPPPSRLVRRLNSRLDVVVMRALENAASRRFRSCAEFAEGIRVFLSDNGGLVPRSDLRKFIDELFPKDIVVGALGPAPFTTEFSLEEISGIPELVGGPEEIAPRAPFSGGAIDERTPTHDGLPVFGEVETVEMADPSAGTLPETPAVSVPSWTAPTAAPPLGSDTDEQPAATGRRKRLRPQEPVQPGPKTDLDLRVGVETQRILRHDTPVSLPAQQMPTDADLRPVRTRSTRRNWQLIGALVCVSLLSAAWAASRLRAAHSDVIGPEGIDCYDAPDGKSVGWLNVVLPRAARVEIDGVTVCAESLSKIPVAAGMRAVRVVEAHSGKVWSTSAKAEVGKVVRLVPSFEGGAP